MWSGGLPRHEIVAQICPLHEIVAQICEEVGIPYMKLKHKYVKRWVFHAWNCSTATVCEELDILYLKL